MKRLKTKSGSIYELRETENLIRRVCGTKEPTPRQGQDGEWKSFIEISRIIDNSMLIIWRYDEENGNKIARSTLTSPIVHEEIVNDDNNNNRTN